MIIKTRASLPRRAGSRQEMHSYTTPAILCCRSKRGARLSGLADEGDGNGRGKAVAPSGVRICGAPP